VAVRPSGKGRLDEGRAFGSRKGKTESGSKREVELGLIAFAHNSEFCY
jgi:hypothetical protein